MTPRDPRPLSCAEAKQRLEAAIREVLGERLSDDPYRQDLQAFLASFDSAGEPRLFHIDGNPARFLTPLLMGKEVGAIVATDPFTGEVLAWPGWLPGPKPAFRKTEDELVGLMEQGDARVGEFVPKTDDRANRFAVTGADLERATLIDGWDAIPYKNQEERWDWVEQVRQEGKMRTQWRYSPGVQYPAYKCLSYAASTVVDWWGWRQGHPPIARYQNFVNGLQEYGLNPREAEVLYHHRAKTHPVSYPRLPAVSHGSDPVTRERIPTGLRAYARLLTTPEDKELADPLFKKDAPAYWYWPGKYHMDSAPKILFTKNRHDEQAIVRALEEHGVVFAMTQTRLLGVLRVGLHAIAIVGHFERDGKLTFIYHESYGNKAAGYHWDNSGGPGLMSIPAKMLRGALCFPHRVWVDVDDGRLQLRHSEGGPLDGAGDVTASLGGKSVKLESEGPGSLKLDLDRAGRVELAIAHRHFFAPDGGPRMASIFWPGHVGPGPELAIARWQTLDAQSSSPGLSHVPLWVRRALDHSVDEVAAWATRTGRAQADRRLAAFRNLLASELPRGDRSRLYAAFPILK